MVRLHLDRCRRAPLWGAGNAALEGDDPSEPVPARGSACKQTLADVEVSSPTDPKAVL